MGKIYVETFIYAPIERVFDLARSIDLHKISTIGTKEKVITGKVTGLIELNETVTWRAKHLGVYQNLTVVVTKLEKPFLFEDKMIKGAFSKMQHTHKFESINKGTKMIEIFEFKSPFGLLGKLVNFIFLKKYMTNFLLTKNRELKKIAVGNSWKEILNNN